MPGWAAFCAETVVVVGGKVRSGRLTLIEKAEAWVAAARTLHPPPVAAVATVAAVPRGAAPCWTGGALWQTWLAAAQTAQGAARRGLTPETGGRRNSRGG